MWDKFEGNLKKIMGNSVENNYKTVRQTSRKYEENSSKFHMKFEEICVKAAAYDTDQ